MNKRMNMAQVAPGFFKAMLSMEAYLDGTTLSKTHRELIKIRASQINGCAYCLDMHTHDARQHGETEQRVYTLSAWRDTAFYTEEEQAILALTEEATQITKGVSDAAYERAIAALGEEYTGHVLAAIIAINAWNRIAISTHMQPAPRKA